MELIDKELLSNVCDEACKSSRLRMNYNFHTSPQAKSQRMLNALQIGTELPIHRHTHTSETYVLLQGKIKVLFYNDDKKLSQSVVLNPIEGKFGVNIPMGQWHTLEVLENNSVIFEVKDGPYTPITPENLLM